MTDYKQFALEKWAEPKYWKDFKVDKIITPMDVRKCSRASISYKQFESNLNNYSYHGDFVTIDHPFMHELIKGLDISQGHKFMNILARIIEMDEYKKRSRAIKISGVSIHTQCATVDQLLQAYWMVFNG